MPLTTLIVGDTRLLCDGLASLLRRDGQCAVLCVAYTAPEALDSLLSVSPDVVLVDVAMAGGFEVVRSIARIEPSIKVVVLGVDESPESVVRCAEAGASGFVPRTASVEELVDILKSAHRGELRCSPEIASPLLHRIGALAKAGYAIGITDSSHLTPREREIAELIGLRLSNKAIAARLGIECATVKNHVHNILAKLHVRRRREIACPQAGSF